MIRIVTLFLFLFMASCSPSAEAPTEKPPSQEEEEAVTLPPEPAPQPEPVVKRMTVGMIGDILLHHPLYTYDTYDAAFQEMLPYFNSIDFLIANQESIPGGVELGLSGYPNFNSPSHIVRDLKKYGVDMISMANNHTLDRGAKGVQRAIATMEQYEMPYVGAYKSYEDRATERIVEVDGITLGIVNYTYGTNGHVVPRDQPYLVNYIEEEAIRQDIRALKEKVDVVIASIHWGIEYQLQESEAQRKVAEIVAEEGAHILFGHHPHVIQPYEKRGNTHIYYSLGNFLSAQQFDSTNIGGIARITIEKTTLDGEVQNVEVLEPEFLPTVVVKEHGWNFKIYPLRDRPKAAIYSEQWMLNHIRLPRWSPTVE